MSVSRLARLVENLMDKGLQIRPSLSAEESKRILLSSALVRSSSERIKTVLYTMADGPIHVLLRTKEGRKIHISRHPPLSSGSLRNTSSRFDGIAGTSRTMYSICAGIGVVRCVLPLTRYWLMTHSRALRLPSR